MHYIDLGDLGDNTSLRATARYAFTGNCSASAGAELDSDTTIWLIGSRYNF
ncbi:MAG TPA: hypothetical protein VHC20_01480 [Candidatus Paceibacterota bacterium]|nr:hypothetical protein [Candidatus Paceibacterota bacterium]